MAYIRLLKKDCLKLLNEKKSKVFGKRHQDGCSHIVLLIFPGFSLEPIICQMHFL